MVNMGARPELHILKTGEEIKATVKKLASEISQDYQDKNPILIAVLKGSVVFLVDLMRLLDFPLEIDFIKVSSYGGGKKSSGKIKLVGGISSEIKGRDVLVVEDIVDTGLTTAFLLSYLKKKKPASVKLCALTEKPSRREVPVKIDYLGFAIPDKFIVGYGLDFNEKFRNLPEICFLED